MFKANRECVSIPASRRQDLADALSSPFSSCIYAAKLIDRSDPDARGQALCSDDPEASKTYSRLKCKDGSIHWIVSASEAVGQKFVSIVAIDPMTGVWYSMSCSIDEIAWVQLLPAEMVEKMPPVEQPFGFADHPKVRSRCEQAK